jgi:hypothetical protein
MVGERDASHAGQSNGYVVEEPNDALSERSASVDEQAARYTMAEMEGYLRLLQEDRYLFQTGGSSLRTVARLHCASSIRPMA